MTKGRAHRPGTRERTNALKGMAAVPYLVLELERQLIGRQLVRLLL